MCKKEKLPNGSSQRFDFVVGGIDLEMFGPYRCDDFKPTEFPFDALVAPESIYCSKARHLNAVMNLGMNSLLEKPVFQACRAVVEAFGCPL